MHGHANDAVDLVLVIDAQIHVKSAITALNERVLLHVLQT